MKEINGFNGLDVTSFSNYYYRMINDNKQKFVISFKAIEHKMLIFCRWLIIILIKVHQSLLQDWSTKLNHQTWTKMTRKTLSVVFCRQWSQSTRSFLETPYIFPLFKKSIKRHFQSLGLTFFYCKEYKCEEDNKSYYKL